MILFTKKSKEKLNSILICSRDLTGSRIHFLLEYRFHYRWLLICLPLIFANRAFPFVFFDLLLSIIWQCILPFVSAVAGWLWAWYQPTNQSTNQPTNQPTNQQTDHPMRVCKLTNWSLHNSCVLNCRGGHFAFFYFFTPFLRYYDPPFYDLFFKMSQKPLIS